MLSAKLVFVCLADIFEKGKGDRVDIIGIGPLQEFELVVLAD